MKKRSKAVFVKLTPEEMEIIDDIRGILQARLGVQLGYATILKMALRKYYEFFKSSFGGGK